MAPKLRRQIAWEAARIVFGHQEMDLHRARWKAARRLCRGRVRPQDIPNDVEIRNQLATLVLGYQPLDGELGESREPDWESRREHFLSLLLPLEHVRQASFDHPEGDLLYHSLQVFELARESHDYDEEFLLAALLHDVGIAIDPRNAVGSCLETLSEFVTDRTYWLIQHLEDGHAILQGRIGARAHRRLREHADYDDLLVLCRADLRGRRPGRQVPDAECALDHIQEINRQWS